MVCLIDALSSRLLCFLHSCLILSYVLFWHLACCMMLAPIYALHRFLQDF
jgi:hypothetical protein